MSKIYSNEDESASKQLFDQYNTESARAFYKVIMGDNGFDIHYGIYPQEQTTMAEATENTVHFMFKQAIKLGTPSKNAVVLDLGAGLGGAAHVLAQQYNCSVTCVNFCPDQNRENLQRASDLSIADQIDAFEMDFHHLHPQWKDQYDIVWSEEAFCHAQNKEQVFLEAMNVLKPGGVFVFTDLMEGTMHHDGDAENFNERNAAANITSSEYYLELCRKIGFKEINYYNLSNELPTNYRKMSNKINENRDHLLSIGLSETFLNNYIDSLYSSELSAANNQLEWGCFVMQKKQSS